MAIELTDQQKKSEEIRKRIVKTAYALFHTYGYDKVSMREIAASCNVTTGALYHHFKSKHDILKASFLRSLDGDVLQEKYKTTETPLQDLEDFLCVRMPSIAMEDGQEITKVRYYSIVRFDHSSILEKCVYTLVSRGQALGFITNQFSLSEISEFLCSLYRGCAYQYSVSDSPVNLKELMSERYRVAIRAVIK